MKRKEIEDGFRGKTTGLQREANRDVTKQRSSDVISELDVGLGRAHAKHGEAASLVECLSA
jgi:hypothetical protein